MGTSPAQQSPSGSEGPGARAPQRRWEMWLVLTTATFAAICGCSHQSGEIRSQSNGDQRATSASTSEAGPVSTTASTTRPASAPQPTSTTQPAHAFDTTAARPIVPRDFLERWSLTRAADFKLVDRLVDKRTAVPPFERLPLPPRPADARLGADVVSLPDTNPFAEEPPLPEKEVSIRVGLARSTYRTREPEEVLAAAQPFIDLTQREVNVRGAPVLLEEPSEIYYGLLDGRHQMTISHVFDYLLVRSWFDSVPDNGTILLSWARPAHPRTTAADADLPGEPGTSIELIVAGRSAYQGPADLRGTRLALAANYVNAPGAFLTRLLRDLGHPPELPFFSSVTLRRYPKDAVIDVLKGKADVACVDQGTVGALVRFYGRGLAVRTLAVSPRYNVDVLYTSANNVATHRTEIELTQRQLTTLPKNPEGQEVLFLFDQAGWENYREGDIAVAREHFGDFVNFLQHTPVDLKPLLDSNAPVDRRTYDRLGDE